MLDLATFVMRLKQVIAWNINPSQNPVEFAEHSDFNNVDSCKQALRIALAYRDSKMPFVIAADNFQALGCILCVEVADDASNWDDIWFLDKRVKLLTNNWFALDEFPQSREAILYCWIPRTFELVVQQVMGLEPLGKFFWRDKQPNMFYNAVILAMTKQQ